MFCAVALAGLGDLPDTLMSRSVIIRMRRRAPGETVEPYRHRQHSPAGIDLSGWLATWTASVESSVEGAWPAMPDGVNDRPADVWEPLLAVADAAGGDWPDRARVACAELVKVSENRDASLCVRLLGDLRAVFAGSGDVDALSTDVILERLCALEEAPWSDLRGKPLDPRGLARRLRQYDIGSTKVKHDGKALQGYRREHLWDAWSRYLPEPGASTPEKRRQRPITASTMPPPGEAVGVLPSRPT